jgi:hypothetical protein
VTTRRRFFAWIAGLLTAPATTTLIAAPYSSPTTIVVHPLPDPALSREIVHRALRILSVIGPGQTGSVHIMMNAFWVLQRLRREWQLQGVDLPPDHPLVTKALEYNLAFELAPEYAITVGPYLCYQAADSHRALFPAGSHAFQPYPAIAPRSGTRARL